MILLLLFMNYNVDVALFSLIFEWIIWMDKVEVDKMRMQMTCICMFIQQYFH